MSLTSLLNLPDVREKFKDNFPKPLFTVHKPIVAPALTHHPQWVGTVFDYLFRFQLERLNRQVVLKNHWVAQKSLLILDQARRDSRNKALIRLHVTAEDIVSRAMLAQEKFLQTGTFSDGVVKLAVRLAQLDTIYRARWIEIEAENTAYIKAKYDELNDPVEKAVVTDLCGLLANVDWSAFKANKRCILNPTFGEASEFVGGADADMLIDDTLIELKTTKSLEFARPTFNQLIGYYLLYKVGGITVGKRRISNLRIGQIGMYSSRYAHLHRVSIKEVVNGRTLPPFLKWFKMRAAVAFPTGF